MNPAEFANIARSEQKLWWYRGMNAILLALIDKYVAEKPGRVLEAGSGTGYLASLVQSRLGWTVDALDLGWQGLQYARRLGIARLVQGDIAALPFPTAYFDAVLSMDVIVHLERGEERRAFVELSRVLREGGLALIRVSALDVLHSRHSTFAGERQRFTRERLMEEAGAAGLEVLRCTYANSLLVPVALAKFRVWEPLTKAPAASGVSPVAPWLDRLLYLPLQAEAALIGAGFNFPLGQSLFLVGRKRASGASGSNRERTL
ncbi:MAG: class I SAM-dependent methyltransferase [Bryobacteraceae bacterium]|nr:class I SAM-dependent methyltransferase [Bryobacteraceae bacterium]